MSTPTSNLKSTDAARQRPVRIGLAIGHGTGHELARVFRQAIDDYSKPFHLRPIISEADRLYHSYASLLAVPHNGDGVHPETLVDADHYERYCAREAAEGAVAIFRTSISAQALYDVRQRLEAVKFEKYDQSQSSSLIVVRDQAQGFYAGATTYDNASATLTRACTFRKDVMGRLVAFAIRRATSTWSAAPDKVTMVYKHHLFDGVLDVWAQEWSKIHGMPITFVQPDTTNRNFLAFGVQGRHLLIASNEYSDISQVYLLKMFAQQVQETSAAENIYLRPDLRGISEYQTVHGSADDIAGKGIVNPTATLRAAAAILEHYAQCPGVEVALNTALDDLHSKGIFTPDQGGSLGTDAFAAEVSARVQQILQDRTSTLLAPTRQASSPTGTAEQRLAQLTKHLSATPQPDPMLLTFGLKTALVIVDWQNDFVNSGKPATPGIKFMGNSSTFASIGQSMARLIQHFRNHGQPILFVRFLGDEKFQRSNWSWRDRSLGRTTGCRENTAGAEVASPLMPAAGDQVFEKHACYDAFLEEAFASHCAKQGIQHLVFAGIYADICVDATLRTGFQKGFWGTVVKDCTTTLHLDMEQYLRYTQQVYGTRVVASDELMKMKV